MLAGRVISRYIEDSVSETEQLRALYAEAEQRFARSTDPAHNWQHVQRVYRMAMKIAEQEGADRLTVGAAALLHDLGRLATDKTHPDHSERSARMAAELLRLHAIPAEKHEPILHAIRAHSFSRGLLPQTLEAAVLRDADWLDALGAIGIMRWAITTSRREGIDNYHPIDPFAEQRSPDERSFMLDRFFTKLLRLPEAMLTSTGRRLAVQRMAFMRSYLEEFRQELTM
jgi:uncharacterized protein